ncbi:MAG: hypothetical protein QM811_28555 [Pirellulales bacterium]
MTNVAPDIASYNSFGTPRITETSGTSFLTGGGNIYSFAAPTAFTMTVPKDITGANKNYLLQIKTQGRRHWTPQA